MHGHVRRIGDELALGDLLYSMDDLLDILRPEREALDEVTLAYDELAADLESVAERIAGEILAELRRKP